MARNSAVDDATFAQIRFENGATIVLEATWALNLPGGGYVQIAGTKAGAQLNPLTIYTEKDGEAVDSTPEVPEANSFDEETRHFVDCILNGNEPISSPRQGVTLMQMLDGIYLDFGNLATSGSAGELFLIYQSQITNRPRKKPKSS